MSTLIAVIILIALASLVIALNIWWRHHRAAETRAEQRREDPEIETELRTW